jgi:hypothetical protein
MDRDPLVQLIRKIQLHSSSLQEGMKFLIINVFPTQLAIEGKNVWYTYLTFVVASGHSATKESTDIEERQISNTKGNLLLLLRVLDYLCGYHETPTLVVLERQFSVGFFLMARSKTDFTLAPSIFFT